MKLEIILIIYAWQMMNKTDEQTAKYIKEYKAIKSHTKILIKRKQQKR